MGTREISIAEIVKFNTYFVLLLGICLIGFTTKASANNVNLDWVDQFGPTTNEYLSSVDNDGNVYIAGTTDFDQSLAGQINLGSRDAFVKKYDSTGNEVWTRQFGTSQRDRALRVVVYAGNVYVFGETNGVFPGETAQGGTDGYIRKYDSTGTEQWTRQFGTSNSETVWNGAADSNGVYAVGRTSGVFSGETNQGGDDGYVVAYSAAGDATWLDMIGTDSEYDDTYAVFANGTHVYVGGTTGYGTTTALGSLNYGEGDGFLRQYNASGEVQWTTQFGTSDYDQVFNVVENASGIYAVGETYGAFSSETQQGNGDIFVAQFNTSGVQQWLDQVGSPGYDTAFDIAADSTGIYIAGFTSDSLPGQTNAGSEDAYIAKYNETGEQLWIHQFGTSASDHGYGLSLASGAIFITGRTYGSFPGETNSGGSDTFLARFLQLDSDSDGILDSIDVDALNPSDDYSDGTTSGTINTPGDQIVTIEDAADPGDGVLASTTIGGGATPAQITSCSGTVTTYLDAGESATITCGSAIINAVQGVIQSVFFADNGSVSTINLTSGNEVTFKPEDATITAPESNPEPVDVVVEGSVITVQPGEIKPVFLSASIDIKPGNSQNTINVDSNGVIPVAILTTESFNVADVDQLTVKLEGAIVKVKGKSYNIGSFVDIDNDGDLDLLLHIQNDLQLVEGATTAKLTGKTKTGIPFGGSDSILIVH